MQQRQVTKVLMRARELLCHPPSALRGGRPCSPVLQSRLNNVKKDPRVPSILRHFSSGHSGFPSHVPLKSLGRVRLATFESGRRSGVFVGVVTATSYFAHAEGLEEFAHCESDQSHRSTPPPNEVVEWDSWRFRVGRAIRRLWAPSLCVLTISLSWQYPLSLLLNLAFLMWTTKPTPASIYIWVEEMRQQEALKTRGLDRMRAQAAGVMHVEVRDNILFCLARVTSLSKRSTLVGFLGDWWVLSSSSSAIHTGVKLRNLIPAIGPFPWERRYV